MIQTPYTEMTESEAAAVEAFKADMPTYNVKQAAAVLGVSVRTVMTMIKDGRLHGAKIGRGWKFTAAELRRVINGGDNI